MPKGNKYDKRLKKKKKKSGEKGIMCSQHKRSKKSRIFLHT